MPIVVSHQPDASLLAQAGYQVGAGEQIRWQQEMAMRERMQMRQIQASLLQQDIREAGVMQRMLAGSMLDSHRQAVYQQQQNDFRRKMADIEAQQRADAMQYEWDRRREMEVMSSTAAENQDYVKFLMGQADNTMSNIRDMLMSGYQWEQPEEGNAKWSSLLNDVEAIMGDQTLSGMAKAQALYKKVNSADLPKLKMPSVQDELEQRTATLPDGTVVGRAREYSVLSKPDPDRDDLPEPRTPLEMINRDATFNKSMLDQAMEALKVTKKTPSPTGVGTVETTEAVKPEDAAKWVFDYVTQLQKLMVGP